MRPKTALFTIYSEMPQRVPQSVWRALRWLIVAATMCLAVIAIRNASLGAKIFWGAYVPILPLVFLIAPGLWRNICPMASLNQIPRTLGFTRGWRVPPKVQQIAPLISAGLFFLIVPLRRAALDRNGIALGAFILLMLALAFAGGVLFKGKSGWCSQFCPMLQIERFYGQSPLLVVPNAHCRPCVACTHNCYDFNPTAAYLADLHDGNPRLRTNRTLFAGAMPWLIAAFFTQPDLAHLTLQNALGAYGRILLFIGAGIGVFIVIQTVTQLSEYRVAQVHVLAAINLFYWFGAAPSLRQLGLETRVLPHLIQAGVALMSLVWIYRSLPRERAFLSSSGAPPRVADKVLQVQSAMRAGQTEVAFVDGPTILARGGGNETLLELAEANGVAIESGCRLGMCGADPVSVVRGAENLSPAGWTERATLERLGLPGGCRMACVARVHGPVTVTTSIQIPDPEPITLAPPAEPSVPIVSDVQRVVVIGSGVAGVTAALELRQRHAACEITLIGGEPYDFYNRMSIGKLVSESTSIDKLYLMPKGWAETRSIRYVCGTEAQKIDPTAREVITGDGEAIPYDRLILATGARSFVPPIDGFGMAGTFVLRTIDDGVEIQQHVRRRRAKTAAVVGGGLLGLEAAYAMTQLGVRVYVLDIAPWPLNRQLDQRGGAVLRQIMSDLGVEIMPEITARRIVGCDRVEAVELINGQTLPADLCLIAAGIRPDAALAEGAGLAVHRGIVVNDGMLTSDPSIYAVGDVIDHRGKTYGLWPASMDQARVAVTNLLGGDAQYAGTVPPTRLKVACIDLLSVGEIHADRDALEFRFEEPETRQYRKLLLRDGRVTGAILIGHRDLADAVSNAVSANQDATGLLDSLERGDWSGLATRELETVAS